MSEPIRYGCGCANATDPTSGVLRSVEKCAIHKAARRDPGCLDRTYFRELGVFRDGIPLCRLHVGQLHEALGAFPPAPEGGAAALEIGPGVSFYAGALIRAGYDYHAVEPSPWAADWLDEVYGDCAIRAPLEAMPARPGFALILAAHCLEHTIDAPAAIKRCAAMLVPGGELWIVVPDDGDPVNPDHNWYFDQDSLGKCIEAADLTVERQEVRRYVPQEQFLYCRARKTT